MLEYDRIDMSKGINFNKTNGLHECIIFYYWQFREINFKFHPKVCDGSHDLIQWNITFNHFPIVSVKGNDH